MPSPQIGTLALVFHEAWLLASRPAQIWAASQVITTDFFAFDDTTDHYGLQSQSGPVTADHPDI